MDKFIFLLDIHFGKKCTIRLDDIDLVLEDKFEQILNYCLINDVKKIFIAGDVFDGVNVSMQTLIKATNIFKNFKDNGVEVYSIWGNHDEYRGNPDFRSKTPFYLLKQMDLIKPFQEIELDDYIIYGYDYYDIALYDMLENNKEYIKTKDKKIIVLAHSFYDNEFMGGKYNVKKEWLEKGSLIDYIILGHDHSEYDDVTIGNTKILRFGSLTRVTSSVGDINRIPKFVVFDNEGYKKINIKCNELKEVLSSEVINKKNIEVRYETIIEEINKISKEKENEKTSILEEIKNIENEEVKNIILGVL